MLANWKAKQFAIHTVRAKCFLSLAEVFVGAQLWQCNWIVDAGLDTVRHKVRS